MAYTAVRAAKASSSEQFGKTWATPVGTIKTALWIRDRGTDANTAAIRSAWPWAWREKVSKQEMNPVGCLFWTICIWTLKIKTHLFGFCIRAQMFSFDFKGCFSQELHYNECLASLVWTHLHLQTHGLSLRSFRVSLQFIKSLPSERCVGSIWKMNFFTKMREHTFCILSTQKYPKISHMPATL